MATISITLASGHINMATIKSGGRS
ncbi:hypothetical protein BLA29_015003 [Euroglyphus maynei]|uniref:Uncharacterized protein n=1 Tax=Euroglyphus maynei TaxID=6958 RepID=A0A1Y3B206_EURMA|nr:hypothetical protein BLA29_015003 [Euroglyphus maynei]